VFYAYGSNDAGKLAEALGVTILFPYGNSNSRDKHERDVMRDTKMSRFVNYGCRKSRVCMLTNTLNYNAEDAMSKVYSFARFDEAGIPHPELVNPETFSGPYIGRVDGKSQGRGMTLYRAGERPTKPHDFYVAVLPFGREYRLHVAMGEVILTANKVVPRYFTGIARSHKNGCRMVPGAIKNMPEAAAAYAIAAVKALRLDFGAVDVYETPDGKPHILEINTAPGLEFKASIDAYTAVFKQFLKEKSDGVSN
jgi:hypothetical protein